MNYLLGRGPVAEVYAVEGTALKVFPGKFDRRTLATIERERGKLATAPVLRVDGVEVVKGRHALRMELCVDSLASRVLRDGPLGSEEVAALCAVLSNALATAHGLGVLHGGVSPSNVLFRASGEPVLADLGVAQRQAFRRDPLYGVEWVSPETLRTGEVDTKTDLYGLGAVLHFALTGESPHPTRIGESTGERILRVLGDPVPAISRPDVPIGLSTTIGRLLAPDPAKRKAPWAEGVPAPRPRSRPRLWRWAVPAFAALATVLAVVFWPRPVQSQPPPTEPAATGPVIVIDQLDDRTDEVAVRWTTTDDQLYFAVVYWAEGEENDTDTEMAEFSRTKTVPVEPGRGYCFQVRGTMGEEIHKSETRALRGAACHR